MDRTIRLVYGVCQWLEEKAGVLDAYWIMSVVQWADESDRKYYTDCRFTIENVRRKTNKRILNVTIWVEETDVEYVVLQVHIDD